MRNTAVGAVIFLVLASGLSAQTLTRVADGSSFLFEEGWSISRAGDVNDDGIVDLLVGCTDSVLGNGSVKVVSLADGSTIRTLTGTALNDQFGAAIDGGLDVDGDTIPDILVGAPSWDLTNSFDNRGRAYVFSGSTGLLIFQVTGLATQDQLGSSVALIPDLNSDGRAEVAVGLPGSSLGTGAVIVYTYTGSTAIPLYTFPGAGAGEKFGSAVSPIGSVDGDNIPDILIGAPYNAVALGAGRVYMYSGATGNLIRTVDGQQAAEHMGFSLSGLDDVDGDTVPDFIVGAPDFNAGPTGSLADGGRASAISGATGTYLWSVEGPHVYMKAGLSVDAVDDLDGDGINDAVVGMPYLPP